MTIVTDLRSSVPFTSVETAWFWTMKQLELRRDGGRVDPRADQIVQALDRLYRRRKIELSHARILRIWGERGVTPDASIPIEAGDARLWSEAIERLTWPLKSKGLVK